MPSPDHDTPHSASGPSFPHATPVIGAGGGGHRMTLEEVAMETFRAGGLLLFPPSLDLNHFQRVGCGLEYAPRGNADPPL